MQRAEARLVAGGEVSDADRELLQRYKPQALARVAGGGAGAAADAGTSTHDDDSMDWDHPAALGMRHRRIQVRFEPHAVVHTYPTRSSPRRCTGSATWVVAVVWRSCLQPLPRTLTTAMWRHLVHAARRFACLCWLHPWRRCAGHTDTNPGLQIKRDLPWSKYLKVPKRRMKKIPKLKLATALLLMYDCFEKKIQADRTSRRVQALVRAHYGGTVRWGVIELTRYAPRASWFTVWQ